jgi:hypothetical protein
MGYHLDASVDREAVPIHDHKLTIKGNKTLELHPDMLSTGQLISHDSSSPYHFLTHTPIGSRYPDKGYDAFHVFDQAGERVRLCHPIIRLLFADHIQPRRSRRFSRRPNFPTPIWSTESSNLPRVYRPSLKSSSRDHRAASDWPSTLTVSRLGEIPV